MQTNFQGEEPDLQNARSSRLIPMEQKLLLEALTELGLSDNSAGAMIGLTSCSRILRGLRAVREEHRIVMESLPQDLQD